MTTVRDLLSATRRELHELIVRGHAVDSELLDDTEYRGTSLGLSSAIERLTWKTFRKTFHRDPRTGLLRGWNVRLVQRGVDGPSEPLLHGGEPVTFGHYVVVSPRGFAVPAGCDRGLLLDYGLGDHGSFSPMALLRDPVVALEANSSRLLLGWTYLQVGRYSLGTPSYFVLEREGPLSYRATIPSR